MKGRKLEFLWNKISQLSRLQLVQFECQSSNRSFLLLLQLFLLLYTEERQTASEKWANGDRDRDRRSYAESTLRRGKESPVPELLQRLSKQFGFSFGNTKTSFHATPVHSFSEHQIFCLKYRVLHKDSSQPKFVAIFCCLWRLLVDQAWELGREG